MNKGQKISLFKTGKQGIAGKIEIDNESIAFKVSQNLNHLIEHEFNVMSRLSDIDFCPNFCSPIEMNVINTEPKFDKTKNPFEIVSKYPIKKSVLMEEYVPGHKLSKHIKSDQLNTSSKVIYSAIKQVMAAIAIAQKRTHFTHYDLHSDNIILKKCDRDNVFLYVLDEETQILIPSMGYIPVIIDYGFSYIDSLEGQYMSASLGHTEIGFTSHKFDWVSDPKLFLVTIFNELNDYRKTKNTKKFENIVRNMFSSLSIDWECGWDNTKGDSASDILIEKLEEKCKISSKIFSKHACYSVDLLCSLIVLPLKEKKHNELYISFSTFVTEFQKIEREIQSSQYNLYILKNIVDSAQRYKDEYLTNPSEVLGKFKIDLNSAILSVSKFCSPRKIHYEKMLCSLYNFANCAEGFLFNTINKQMKYKATEYKELNISSILDVVNILNVNIEDDYVYNENTKLIVIDSINKSRKEVDLEDETIDLLNETLPCARGYLMYNKYKQEEDEDEEENELSDEDNLTGVQNEGKEKHVEEEDKEEDDEDEEDNEDNGDDDEDDDDDDDN